MVHMANRNSGRTAEQPQLPIPESTAWYTLQGAAEFLGVHKSTITKWIGKGILVAYAPRAARDERVQRLLYVGDVEKVGIARNLLKPRQE